MTNKVPINQAESSSIPDVGWLFQNDQASDESLCKALLAGYATEIERLAFALLKSPADMLDVVSQTVVMAILNRKRYSGEVAGRAWILKLALGECLRIAVIGTPGKGEVYTQAANLFSLPALVDGHSAGIFQNLGQKSGFLLVLHHGLGLNEEEIGYLLARRVDQIRLDLKNLNNGLREHQENCPQCLSAADNKPSEQAVSLYNRFITGCPVFNFSEENWSNWNDAIMRRVTRLQKTRQTGARRTQAAQISALAIAVFFLAGLINTVWSRKASSPASYSSISGTSVPSAIASPPASRPRARLPVQQTPAPTIPAAATPDIPAMVRLANSSLSKWRTLWADVQVINYSPYDNASNPQITRKQLWISRSSSSTRLISGPEAGSPDLTEAIINNHLYIQDFQNGQTSDNLTSDLIVDPDLQKLFLPGDMIMSDGALKYVGTEVVANRAAWILDREQGDTISNIYAIDQEYGVLLYLSVYGGKDMKTKLSETIVTSILYNPRISPSIFNPVQYLGDHFAYNLSGVPEIANVQKALAAWTAPRLAPTPLHVTPSPPFNPSGSQLTLLDQKTTNGPDTLKPGLDLFADGVYLGVLPLEGGAMLSCERSSDGTKIAYNSVGASVSEDTSLMLADLSALQTAHPVMPDGFTNGDYAFAPDSRHLAFYGCDKPGGFCGVFILDLVTGKLTRLLPLLYADYMFWSPDGHNLAMVGAQDAQALMAQKRGQNLLLSEVSALSQPWYFFVLDASSGNIVFNQEFEWSTLKPPADSPTNSWSPSFKIKPGGFAGCVYPPAK